MTAINLIIYRLPDQDGDMQFVELDWQDNTLATKGHIFSVKSDNDNYRSMGFDHIVLALRIPGGSRDLERYAIGDSEKDDDPATVHKIDYVEMQKIVEYLVQMYMESHN